MEYAFDLALLFISTCSALYCWTLSRRLKALQNLRKGVGEAMVNLTKSVTAVEANAAKLNREAMAAVSELRVMLSRVDACEEQVDLLLGTMDRQSREAWREYQERTDAAHRSLDKSFQSLGALVAQAQGLARDLHSATARAHAATRSPSASSLPVIVPPPTLHEAVQEMTPAAESPPAAAPAEETAPKKDTVKDEPRTEKPKRATRTVISGEREMTAREVALAKILAARRARKEKDRADAEDGAREAGTSAEDAVAAFQKRMRAARRATPRSDKPAAPVRKSGG